MDTRPEGLSVNGEEVRFRSLSLGGVRGKVRATLNDNQLSFESKSGQALDIKINAIQRIHHHNTTLVPGWLAVVGLICIWVAWRGVTGKLQALFGAAGIVLSASHLITRRPTLTIDTKAKDCHTIFGSDLAMMKLCALIQQLQNGLTISEAKSVVDEIVSDSEYPRSINSEVAEVIPTPAEIFPSNSIVSFIDSMEDYADNSLPSAEENHENEIVDLDLPMWDDETVQEEIQMPPGLMERSRQNLVTQRNQIIQNGWQSPESRPVYNNVHRTDIGDAPSYGMIEQNTHVASNYPPANTPVSTPLPNNFLPSFYGATGAHIPSTNTHEFVVPDSPLIPEEAEQTKSLVEASRKEEIIEASIIPEDNEPPSVKYPSLSRLKSMPVKSRLKVKQGKPGRMSARNIISELLLNPAMGGASKLTRRIRRKRNQTTESLRVQSENNRQAQIAESIQNIAKSNGGVVREDQIDAMLSHISPRLSMPSTFSQCVSSGSKARDDVEAIPRIDD